MAPDVVTDVWMQPANFVNTVFSLVMPLFLQILFLVLN